MLGLSVLLFGIMRMYESHLAGWGAVVFGFASITTMIIGGLRKLRDAKISKYQA